ncbi:MAG: YceD family protein [Ilumatobacteraceae bacterium]
MSDPLRPLRVNAVELLRQPGAERAIDVTIEAEPLEVEHERLAGDLSVALRLESVNDGILVTGTVSAPWSGSCRRCLEELSGTATAEVDELYQREITDQDAFAIESNQLDLVPLTREAILLELDAERVCRDECAGLCPVCGIDRNDHSCDCVTDVRDERWAALDALRVED